MREVRFVLTEVMIRKYRTEDFDELAKVMDEGRMQELEAEGLEQVFVSLKDAPYLKYFLSCDIYVAEKDEQVVGFIGLGRRRLDFLYVLPGMQGKGIGSALMKTALTKLPRPVRLAVFTNNEQAKNLYKKFGFKVTETRTEKWSDEFPVVFSEDTMELE
ncbi:GNAT family N-acetyltransferase [Lactobacillus hamsteri]|uniref:GNAT family N-acetyltransferase n=1 Tax=Lactobacillus hamsteri TaxID=96565 RepID=UPI0005527F8E|nr:GNAT family N-acetyltransferase [Lactobacillus hamsteri]